MIGAKAGEGQEGSGQEFAGVGGDEPGWADDEGVGDTDNVVILVGIVEPGED